VVSFWNFKGCFCFAENTKSDEACSVVIANDATTSFQKSDSDEMPNLSPPAVNFKLQATMPDLVHSDP